MNKQKTDEEEIRRLEEALKYGEQKRKELNYYQAKKSGVINTNNRLREKIRKLKQEIENGK